MKKQLFDLFIEGIKQLLAHYVLHENLVVEVQRPAPPKPVEVPENPYEEVPDTIVDTRRPGSAGTSANSKLYVPLASRQEWIDKLENAYSVWQGERDYDALLRYPAVFDDPKFPYDPVTITRFLRDAQEVYAKSQRLQHRIDTERHRKFRDRSQVRKYVVNDMYELLLLQTARHTAVASFFPETPLADSMKGKLEQGIFPSTVIKKRK